MEDNKFKIITPNGRVSTYSKLQWHLAWLFVFICGVIIGIGFR